MTWESGIPANIRSWFLNASHGDLADHRKAFPGFVDLLQRGDTNNPELSIEPIVERGETEQPFHIPVEDTLDMFPDEAMIMDSIMGTERNSIITTKPTTALKNCYLAW